MSQQLTEEAIDCLRSFVLAGGSLVLDAGALHGITALLTKSGPFPPGKILLTPHPGEWNRMQDLAAPPPLTPDGSMSAALQCAKLGIHIIYKNAAPVIISPEQVPPLICAAGTTILARAGAGDLLAGMIAAHLAVGCSPDFAAARAYTLLSRTAWIAAQDVGEDAVIASDITARLGIGARL
jgi:NAD(P)H-hydrate epimerase